MAGFARRSGGADDAALAQRAAAGDGDAFAKLYERHERRVYNLCYRILGSRDDAADATQEAFLGILRRLPQLAGRELAFGSYVLTSARNASYDQIERRKRAQPTEDVPEPADPVTVADPEDDPERNVLLAARAEEVRAANLSLPERQREVLALRELEELSYDEIAELMDMNRNSVAQLISRARINLRDALRGSALASVAASSPDCERALPLIALEQDGQLDVGSNDAGWLGEHLMHCHTCRLGRDAMQEAGVSYRAWAPIAAGPPLFRETMARAAELVGADWSETIARHGVRRGGGAAGAAGAAAGPGSGSARAAVLRHRRRDLTLVGVLTCVLVLGVLVGVASDGDPGPTVAPAAEERRADEPAGSGGSDTAAERGLRERRQSRRERRRSSASAPPEPAAPVEPGVAPVVEPVVEPEPAPAEPVARPKPRRPRDRDDADRRADRGKRTRPLPEVPPEPPAPPPTETTPTPPPPPPETTPEPPPRQPPPSCIPSPSCQGGQPPPP